MPYTSKQQNSIHSQPSAHICCIYCDIGVTGSGIPAFDPETQSECAFLLLLQLDDIKDPGVSRDVFEELFVKCRTCHKYMTRRSTIFHDCPGARGNVIDVIDLTNED
jgi:hypothetical protein